MKTPNAALLPWALAFAFTACWADTPDGNKPASAEDIALFGNGDTLRGSIAGYDKAGLHWKPAYEGEPVVVTTKYLAEIRIHPRKMPDKAAQAPNDVVLTNGDLLPGTLVSFDGKSFLLDTWYAGRLAIPRSMIKTITATAAIYNGPESAEGWAMEQIPGQANTWTCKDGLFSNSGSGTIGRDLKLPSASRIQFSLSGGAFEAKIYICADRPSNPGNFFMFHVRSDNPGVDVIDFSHYSRDTTMTTFNNPIVFDGENSFEFYDWAAKQHESSPSSDVPPDAGLSAKTSSGATHFDIRINKEAKTVSLYLNGKMAHKYSELNDLPGTGGSLIFSWVNGGLTLRVGKIQVGSLSGGPDPAGNDATAASDDCVEAVNRNPVHGQLKKIANGMALIASPKGDTEIPSGEIESINLSSEGAHPPETGANDVRARLLGYGRVTMEIESWDANGVTVTSPDFGRAVFSPEVFRHLQFNLQNQPAPHGGDAVDTDGGGDDN